MTEPKPRIHYDFCGNCGTYDDLIPFYILVKGVKKVAYWICRKDQCLESELQLETCDCESKCFKCLKAIGFKEFGNSPIEERVLNI